MLIVAYDISSTRIRTRFSKFLKKYGRRVQYSVFELKHSPRVLKNVIVEIEDKYEPQFSGADSILIFQLGQAAKIHRYGYAKNEEKDIIFL